jgi:type I restriction enzyme M protein
LIVHDCRGFEDLLRLVRERYFALQRGQWVFRGQSNAQHRLIPSVGRIDHVSVNREKAERSLLSIFQRSAIQYVERVPLSDWEWLALAQHHRLPTRLLDWSFNPSVALYFAVSEAENVDGLLYALHVPRKIGDDERRRVGPLEIQRPVKYFPEVVTPRLAAQEGLFSLHARIEEPLDEQLPDTWKIEAISISAEQKAPFRYLLFRHGIHESALFPGLDGLARHVSWQHTVSPARSLGL